MTLDWAYYSPFVPTVAKPHDEMSRAEARLSFDEAMAARPERRHQLDRLLGTCGMSLSSTDAGIQELNDWFRSGVERDDSDPDRLAPRWYAVVFDVGLYLGDVAIERNPGLRWELFLNGKNSLSYQKHVVKGFTKVPSPTYHIDFDRLTATIGHRAFHGLAVPASAFLVWLNSAADDA